MANSPVSGDSRNRLPASIEAICKRKLRKIKVKAADKPLQQDRSACRVHLLKLVLVTIVSGTLSSFFYFPDHGDPLPRSGARPSFVNKLIWGGSDRRYMSDLDINWSDLADVLSEKTGLWSIGLLNFDNSEVRQWQEILPSSSKIVIQLDYAETNVTWDSLYPEWIDEEQEGEVPVCPDLPKIEIPRRRLDLVAVKLPCRKEANWPRDVARLHLQLSAATLAALAKGFHHVRILIITECLPLPNLFRCKELKKRKGNVWLYEPDIDVLREKLRLPVGSCELALPLGTRGNSSREAYATILHSAHDYVCGAITAGQSIRQSGSTRDLVLLVDENISPYHRSGLESAGWKIRTIQRIRNPKAEKDAYNEWNYSKFRLWQLTDYDKIIFIDADLLILRNIDFLFSMPEISATGNNGTLFNSGVMVIEPSNCTFNLLMDHINDIESYNGGDQGYLNEIFTWWHRIPRHMNFLKHFWVGDEEEVKMKKTQLFGADPPVLYVLHYLGIKPWLCYRDYDCNFNSDIFQEFASDVAHKTWWRVHDRMPKELHQFCYLRSKQKAQLEWDRRQAEKENFRDRHWKLKVKDRRRKVCIDKLCDWKSMLGHWGETNWTDGEAFTPSPPALTAKKLTLPHS